MNTTSQNSGSMSCAGCHGPQNDSAKMWSLYISEADKHDKALVRKWKGDMDAILIFAGLFSACLTAFIIESYKLLRPDPSEMTDILLYQLAKAVSDRSDMVQNGSVPLVDPTSFNRPVTLAALACNMLWFLSLAFILACALAATLVQGWIRNYEQAPQQQPCFAKRARIRAYLHEGLVKFGMEAVVESIPLLLHTSLFLFFAGLVVFLIPENTLIGYLLLFMLAFCVGLYGVSTVLPLFYHDCPYQTPLSNLIWRTSRFLSHILSPRRYRNDKSPDTPVNSLVSARSEEAVKYCKEREDRDVAALSWMFTTLADDSVGMETFVSLIPGLVYSPNGMRQHSYDGLITMLLKDDRTRLENRILRLLGTCESPFLSFDQRQCRTEICLKALWSMVSIAASDNSPAAADGPICHRWFNSDTEVQLQLLTQRFQDNDYLVSSTIALIRTTLLRDLVQLLIGTRNVLIDLREGLAIAVQGGHMVFPRSLSELLKSPSSVERRRKQLLTSLKTATAPLSTGSCSKTGRIVCELANSWVLAQLNVLDVSLEVLKALRTTDNHARRPNLYTASAKAQATLSTIEDSLDVLSTARLECLREFVTQTTGATKDSRIIDAVNPREE